MNRSREYYLHHRNRIINKKKKIAKQLYGEFGFYNCDGAYNKGKIHCSCWMCSEKTKYHGEPISDIKKKMSGVEED